MGGEFSRQKLSFGWEGHGRIFHVIDGLFEFALGFSCFFHAAIEALLAVAEPLSVFVSTSVPLPIFFINLAQCVPDFCVQCDTCCPQSRGGK